MTVEIKPEDEELIQKRLRSGVFNSIEEVIHDALATQNDNEDSLQENKGVINEKIARGIAQLDRCEGVQGDVARARLQVRKAAWLAEHQRS